MSSVPLLFYIVIATENKRNISRRDWHILISVSAGMILGFSLQFISSLRASIIIITIALCLVGLALTLLVLGDPETTVSRNKNPSAGLGNHISYSKLRSKLAWQLMTFMPSFPAVYFLSFSRIIGHDTTAVLLMVCNLSTKIIFISIVMASHVEVMYMLFVVEAYLNSAKRSFLRYIMHEVRVPLSSITMGISLLEESRQLNDEDRESLLMMKGATSFMQETLNDVLCMQKIEEGKLELIYAPFRAVDVVQVVRSVLQGTMSQKNIHLYTLVYDDVPEFVIGDRFRIEHVLANLLSNAIKFSPSHGRIVMIVSMVGGCGSASAYLQAEDSVNVTRPSAHTRAYTNASRPSEFVQLEFSVRDEGPGISLEDQKKLFQDFVQIKPGEMQGGGGSGVGLSLCKQIVELHDGTIKCSSEVGQGSTFSVIIPFKIHLDGLVQNYDNPMESKSVRVEDEVKSPKISPVQSSYFQIVGIGDVSITGEEGELGLLTLCNNEILPKSKASSFRQSLVIKSHDERKSATLLENVDCACLGTSEGSGAVVCVQHLWRILLVDGKINEGKC